MRVGLREQPRQLVERGTDLLALPRQCSVDGAHHGVELVGLEVGEHVDQLLENGIEFDDDPVGRDDLPGVEVALRSGLWDHQVDGFGPENRVGFDVCGHVRGDLRHFVAVDVEVEHRVTVGLPDRRDPADLHTAQFHLGVGTHHQTGSRRVERDRLSVGEPAEELCAGTDDNRDETTHHDHRCRLADQWAPLLSARHLISPPG